MLFRIGRKAGPTKSNGWEACFFFNGSLAVVAWGIVSCDLFDVDFIKGVAGKFMLQRPGTMTCSYFDMEDAGCCLHETKSSSIA